MLAGLYERARGMLSSEVMKDVLESEWGLVLLALQGCQYLQVQFLPTCWGRRAFFAQSPAVVRCSTTHSALCLTHS